MNPHDSQKKLKDIFSDPRIPRQIDISAQVMERIKQKKERFLVKYKVSILVVIGLLASITTGYAAVQYYQLKNPQGEVIYQEKNASEAPNTIVKEPDGEMLAFLKKKNEVEEKLAPGTAFAAYIVPHNPSKRVMILSKPYEYVVFAELRAKIGGQAVVPEALPGGFAFAEGTVENRSVKEFNKEALYQQAEVSKQEYVLQPLNLLPDLEQADVTYKAGDTEVYVSISNFEGVRDNTVFKEDMDKERKEKLKVGPYEVLFTEQDRGDHVNKELVWIMEHQGKKKEYRVATNAKELTKDSAEKFVKAFLPAK